MIVLEPDQEYDGSQRMRSRGQKKRTSYNTIESGQGDEIGRKGKSRPLSAPKFNGLRNRGRYNNINNVNSGGMMLSHNDYPHMIMQ